MFARVKKSGKYQYLQIVENNKLKGKVKQRVIATVGCMDRLQSKGRVETLIRSLSRFSEQALLIISGQSNVAADAKKIGPALIFERLWQETGTTITDDDKSNSDNTNNSGSGLSYDPDASTTGCFIESLATNQ
jgi:hypothetical protein